MHRAVKASRAALNHCGPFPSAGRSGPGPKSRSCSSGTIYPHSLPAITGVDRPFDRGGENCPHVGCRGDHFKPPPT
jgi:hypothetical protein